MFWVVQDNIYREYNHGILMQTLQRMDIPHSEVKVVPFFDMLLPSNFDSHNYKGEINNVKEAEIDDSGFVMVCGGIYLANIAKKRNWEPGSFLNDNFHYNKWKDAYGRYLLNYESLVGTFKSINPEWDEFFIRPCEDTKDFNGQVFSKGDFIDWRNNTIYPIGSCKFENSEVVISPTQKIYAEYRFFVVDGKVITGSQYKLGSRLCIAAIIDSRVIDYVQRMVDKWQPAIAFVIDIAEIDEGLKIIEINNFNSAGFYACDVSKIIDAIELLENKF